MLFFHHGAGGDDQRGVDLFLGHAVKQALQCFVEYSIGRDVFEAFTGFIHNKFQATQVQRYFAAISVFNANAGVGFLGHFRTLLGALFGAGRAVQYVGASNFVLAAAHQSQLDLVLNFFNVDGSTRGHAALEGGGNLIRQLGYGFMNTGRGRGIATLYSQKRFGDGDTDFVIGVAHH